MIVDKHEALYKDVSSLEVVAYTTRGGDFEDGVTFILEKLDAIPVADVQPVRHGHWIEEKTSFEDDWGVYNYIWYLCSECRSREKRNRKYCPECGAKMDGE